MRNGFVVILVLNLMVLSSWEAMHFFHSLLHRIPNPFHHHGHHADLPVYHHDYLDPQASHSHSHTHQEGLDEHNLSDHLDLSHENDTQPYSKSHDNNLLKDFFKLTGKLEKAIFDENDFAFPFRKADLGVVITSPTSFKGRPDVPPPKVS